MKNPESETFRTTVGQWKQLVGVAEDILRDGEKPWTSTISAAYHFVKHGHEFTSGSKNTVDDLCSMPAGKNVFAH